MDWTQQRTKNWSIDYRKKQIAVDEIAKIELFCKWSQNNNLFWVSTLDICKLLFKCKKEIITKGELDVKPNKGKIIIYQIQSSW